MYFAYFEGTVRLKETIVCLKGLELQQLGVSLRANGISAPIPMTVPNIKTGYDGMPIEEDDGF